MRKAFFRNVHLCHHFDAGNDGFGEVGKPLRSRDFAEHAVDAETDTEGVTERFKMDIGGPDGNGLVKDFIDNADDGGLAGVAGDFHGKSVRGFCLDGVPPLLT